MPEVVNNMKDTS